MKKLANVLFRQKIRLDDFLIGGIDILHKLVELLLMAREEVGESVQPDEILDIELLFEDGFARFLKSLERKYYLPFFWEDMYEVYSNLKKVFALLLTYYAEKKIYQTRFSSSHFLELERRILGNVKCFFQAYLGNRKYAEELLKNNQHELKNFVRLYYQGIASIGREQVQSHMTSRLLEVFLDINAVNNSIQDILQKILVDTNL